MKKRIFGMLLMGAMVVASVSMFTSCKDYDDDINNLQKQIDAITAQKLQDQLTTLQSALATAQTAAEAAKAAAATAQTTAEAAQGSANAADAAAKAAQATADAAAKSQTVEDLSSAIEDLKKIIDGKVSAADVDAAIAAAIEKVEAKIVAISQDLLTIADVEELLAKEGFAKQAVVEDLESQVKALDALVKAISVPDPIVDEAWKKSVEDAIASLTQIKKDIASKADKSTVDQLKKSVDAAVEAMKKVDSYSDAINSLNVFVKRNLSSLVLRPDTYYGGIEGVSVYTYVLPQEKNNPEKPKAMYHYFDRQGTINISDVGTAQYHVNPTNVDLTNYTIDFYNWHSNIKEPAATERTTPTRAGVSGGISPVYGTTDSLMAQKYTKDEAKGITGVKEGDRKYWDAKTGILSVPFTANAATIESNLKKGIGTIASLSMTKKGNKAGVADTTVNSDYAIVVPEYGYGLLIGDNTFPVTTRHLDQIGYDGDAVNSSNLHRSFSFLALAKTSPTHKIKYDGSFDITKVLESRYVPVKADYDGEITDTAVYVNHNNHQPIAKWDGVTTNKDQDGDASIDKAKVVTMSDALFNKLGFKYDIQLVNYTLGSNKTGESVHLELITDKNGHVIAYPRNVTEKGETIKGQTANAACVGRQPIVCIMVKDSKDRIVSFAYMKFLITQDAIEPKAKEVDFDIKDIWVNCKADAGRVTWSEIERLLLDQALEGMSKKDFDNNYVFDYYAQTEEKINATGSDATYYRITRNGVQYDAKNGKRIDETKAFGSIEEQWDKSAQNIEDATTHIIKWSFTADQLKKKAEALKDAGKLSDNAFKINEKGKYEVLYEADGKTPKKLDYYYNVDSIFTWVRYAHLAYTPITDMPAIGKKADKGNPSIWVKLAIPVGEFHVAKGDMGANKILTYWYDLYKKQNALGTEDAFEVRINVPVPVPETSATQKTIGYYYLGEKKDPTTGKVIYNGGDPLDIRYDNLLEAWEDDANADTKTVRGNNKYSEFTKNVKDFFIDGKLTATVKKSDKFSSIKGMKLGCEFILPNSENAKIIKAGTNNGIADSWVVNGYTGAKYTLVLNATHTKIQIAAKEDPTTKKVTKYNPYKDLITLNYDENATPTERQITVLNYVNGVDQDDILNYKTHNELEEDQTFTAYLNIKAVDACAPVYWDNMWFNARFLRPLDLDDPKQALVPDAPNDWHEVDLTDALVVIDWREYYGDRLNRTQGKDVKVSIPNVGNVKAFDFAYYQVQVEISDGAYYTDANLGKDDRDAGKYVLDGTMVTVADEKDATAKNKGKSGNGQYIKTSQVPNLKFEKISDTKLRYLNNSGVTGGFHVFVPVTMTYVYGYMTVRQTKWVTVGVTASVEQAMIGK